MNTCSFDVYFSEYKKLSSTMQRAVRTTASLELQVRGVEEIGSSDISCVAYDLYKSLGSFQAIINYGVELM